MRTFVFHVSYAKFFMALILCDATEVSIGQVRNWQNLDLAKDSFFGMSTERAYSELLKGRKSNTVIVAVIDGGIDTSHEDLKSVIWASPVDGSHGRNYITLSSGIEDITEIVSQTKSYYDSLSFDVPPQFKSDYAEHKKLQKDFNGYINTITYLLSALKEDVQYSDNFVRQSGINSPSPSDFRNYKAGTARAKDIANYISLSLSDFPTYFLWRSAMEKVILQARQELETGLNKLAARDTLDRSDDEVSFDAMAPSVIGPNRAPLHGTHVAGIIGAVRNNEIGLNGVADNVRIMMLKIYSNVSLMKDRDLARAIIYAVDHGARVINMSFGWAWSWDKSAVDNAFRYAEKNGVIIVKAAGNEGKNLDRENPVYPNRDFLDGGQAQNLIVVGASSMRDDSSLIPAFTNYGRGTVDVFAPGVQIYSCLPGSKYSFENGSSMAAPMVAGLAALIWEYHPTLTAQQVKDIIIKSVIKPQHFVIVSRRGQTERERLEDLCTSGGIVNAYNALKLANELSPIPN